MPSRNAFSGLEALLDTVPSRAGTAKEAESPAGPAPTPGSPSPAAAKPAPTEAVPPSEAQANEAPAAAARPARPPTSPTPRPPRRAAPAPAEVPRPRPFSVKLPADLLDRARNAAYWVPGVTLTGMIEEGLDAVIERLQREHNGGKPFPARRGPVRTGRPLGR